MNCENCLYYDGTYCTKDLNNLDYSIVTEEMERKPEDSCKEWERDIYA